MPMSKFIILCRPLDGSTGREKAVSGVQAMLIYSTKVQICISVHLLSIIDLKGEIPKMEKKTIFSLQNKFIVCA